MNLNQVTLIGRLGQDPEVKTFENGGKIAIVNIAVDSPYYDEEKDHWVSNPDWIRCVFSKQVAERAEQQLQKGDEILVEGKLKVRQFTDQDDQKRTIAEVKGGFKKNHSKKQSSENNQQQGEKSESSVEEADVKDDADNEGDSDLPF